MATEAFSSKERDVETGLIVTSGSSDNFSGDYSIENVGYALNIRSGYLTARKK